MRRLSLIAGLDEAVHFAEFRGPVDYSFKTLRKIARHQRRSSRRELAERVRDGARWMTDFVVRAVIHPITTWRRAEIPAVDDDLETATCDAASDDSATTQMSAHVNHMSEAWSGYNPRRCEGRVAIIWPREGPANPPWHPRARCDRLTPQLDWYLISGSHWTMLEEHYDEAAEMLAAALEHAVV